MIPDEAVEAAAKAIYEGFHSNYKWEDAPDFDGGFRSISLKQARLALEAAAPYIAAEAWDEGREADDFEVSIGFDGNPYRSQDARAS